MGQKHGDYKLNSHKSLSSLFEKREEPTAWQTPGSSLDAPEPPKKPKVSTFVVGVLVLLTMWLGFASGGLGGALILLAIFSALTGLYVAVTGRRSWARLPGRRKVGGIVLAASLVVLVLGAVILPPPSAESIAAQAASENAKRAEEASRASAAASQTPATPSPTPSPTNTGEPLDPDRVTELAKGVSYTAPKSQPAFATKALDLLALLPVKNNASTPGYSARAVYGQAWADIDRNGCDTGTTYSSGT